VAVNCSVEPAVILAVAGEMETDDSVLAVVVEVGEPTPPQPMPIEMIARTKLRNRPVSRRVVGVICDSSQWRTEISRRELRGGCRENSQSETALHFRVEKTNFSFGELGAFWYGAYIVSLST
jgi:hypothetical protein